MVLVLKRASSCCLHFFFLCILMAYVKEEASTSNIVCHAIVAVDEVAHDLKRVFAALPSGRTERD